MTDVEEEVDLMEVEGDNVDVFETSLAQLTQQINELDKKSKSSKALLTKAKLDAARELALLQNKEDQLKLELQSIAEQKQNRLIELTPKPKYFESSQIELVNDVLRIIDDEIISPSLASALDTYQILKYDLDNQLFNLLPQVLQNDGFKQLQKKLEDKYEQLKLGGVGGEPKGNPFILLEECKFSSDQFTCFRLGNLRDTIHSMINQSTGQLITGIHLCPYHFYEVNNLFVELTITEWSQSKTSIHRTCTIKRGY